MKPKTIYTLRNRLPFAPHEDGRCSDRYCQQYDGKRCGLLGHRPSEFCGPFVSDLILYRNVVRDWGAALVKASQEEEKLESSTADTDDQIDKSFDTLTEIAMRLGEDL